MNRGHQPPSRLSRELGTLDAVLIGLGSMIGAGVFAAIGPAADAAGAGMLIGLAVAAVVAYCNAMSSAQLAAVYPESGGTYVYGRERLGHLWGFLAGWGFVVGKTASCAAMALTFGAYAAPELMRPLAVGAVVALTIVNLTGIRKTAWLTRVIVFIVLTVLASVVVAGATSDLGATQLGPLDAEGMGGILESAGLLFFAFAGYARIATLGEEVRDPARTIPRAIPIALAITLVVYASVCVIALLVLGAPRLADATAPLVSVVDVAGAGWLTGVVRAGAIVASLGVLLSLLVGVSRTTFAMAGAHDLPHWLSAVHTSRKVPHRAEVVIGVLVITVVLVVDVRGAIGFSSFAVLCYYAIANASAFTLSPIQRRTPRFVPVLGFFGCIALALALPLSSVVSGAILLVAGASIWTFRTVVAPRTR